MDHPRVPALALVQAAGLPRARATTEQRWLGEYLDDTLARAGTAWRIVGAATVAASHIDRIAWGARRARIASEAVAASPHGVRHAQGGVRVELLSHEGCLLVEHTRALLRECLAEMGLATPVIERIGEHPSPTVLIDGQDVMGDPGLAPRIAACRLDTPTRARVLHALSHPRHRARLPSYTATPCTTRWSGPACVDVVVRQRVTGLSDRHLGVGELEEPDHCLGDSVTDCRWRAFDVVGCAHGDRFLRRCAGG